MHHHTPLLYVLAVANIIAMCNLGFFMIGANIYDIKQFKRKRSIVQSDQRRVVRKKKIPLVSVVVPAHNEALVIERTLKSILANDYKRFEIIVIDDGSKDKSPAIIRTFIKKHQKLRRNSYVAKYDWKSKDLRRFIKGYIGTHRVVLVSQRNGGKAEAMNNAIKNFVRGELVMCLDADSTLHPEAISRAVRYFDDKRVMGVAANVRVMSGRQWLTILQRFEHLVGYRSKKFYSLTNSEFIIGGVASTYRTDIVRKAGFYDTDTMTEDIGLSLKLISRNGNRRRRIVYASDVVAMTEGVQSFSALLKQRYRWKMGNLQNLYKYRELIAHGNHKKFSLALTAYRLPMAILSEIMLLLQPLLFTYVIYLCISYHTVGILIGAYMTLTVYVLWTVWPDEHLTPSQKFRMSFLALGMYGMFYIMDVVQFYAAIQVIRHRHTVTRRDSDTTWVSPLRAGHAT